MKSAFSETTAVAVGVPVRLDRWLAAGVVSAALLAGIAIGEEKWVFLFLAVGFPLVLLWPIAATFGGFAFLVPFEAISGIAGSQRSFSVATLFGVAAVLALIATACVRRRLKWPSRSVLWWSLFGVWVALSCVWAVDRAVAIHSLPAILAILALYLAASCVRLTEGELKTVFLLAVLGGGVAAATAAFQFSTGSFWGGSTLRGRGSLLLGADEADPNFFAASLLLPLSLAIGSFLSSQKWQKKLLMLALSLVIVFGILVTMSRGALLALIVLVAVFLYHLRARKRALLLAGVFALMLLAMPTLFFQRLQTATTSGGAGRFDIWRAGLASEKRYGLLGAGANNFGVVYSQFAGYAPHFVGFARDSHNVYLQVAVDFGALGVLLFLVGVGSQLRACWNRLRAGAVQNFMLIACEAACCSLLVSGLFSNLLWRKTFWLGWIFMCLVLQLAESAETEPVHLPVDSSSLGAA